MASQYPHPIDNDANYDVVDQDSDNRARCHAMVGGDDDEDGVVDCAGDSDSILRYPEMLCEHVG